MLDVAKGLNRLHEREMIHGDLRSDNIVVSANGNAMLTDFGLSYLANATSVTMMRMKDHLGAMQWRAPEFAWETTTQPLFESDIFSLGMCILEALTGGRPWGQNYDNDYVRVLYRELKPGSNQEQEELPVQRPEMVKDAQWKLIKWMISVNPQARPSMEQVLDELTTFVDDEEFEQRSSSH